MPINPFINDEAYYVIECKRVNSINVNGTSGLNSEYISEGICRFTSGKYSSYYKTNGMIGFVVEPMDINANVTSINNLLVSNYSLANTTQELQYREIVKGFAFSYCSQHNLFEDSVVLYHLMFNFSMEVQRS